MASKVVSIIRNIRLVRYISLILKALKTLYYSVYLSRYRYIITYTRVVLDRLIYRFSTITYVF